MMSLFAYVSASADLLAAVKSAVEEGTASEALTSLYNEAASKPDVFARGHVAAGLVHISKSDASPAIWQAHAAVLAAARSSEVPDA